MAYKAEVTNVSAVDLSGNMTVTFKLTKGENTLYPSVEISGQADGMVTAVTEKANFLAYQIRESKKIKVGDKIDIEE